MNLTHAEPTTPNFATREQHSCSGTELFAVECYAFRTRPGRLKMGEPINANGTEIWTERRGHGPDFLLIAGLGDPAEAWQPQLDGLSDRYRLTAFDNRGAGRTPLPEGRLSAATMADDAAALLRALEVSSAHVAGFSMGSAIAQELALRHPELVRSLVLMSTYDRPDALWRSQLNFWRWPFPTSSPSRPFKRKSTSALR